MKLYIFRHGETDGNLKGICQTADFELNGTGIGQAELLRDKLAKEELPIVYASPFIRAKKTGEIVASSNNAKIAVVDDLREQSFGDAEGMKEADFPPQYKKVYSEVLDIPDASTDDVKLPHGESKREALIRFKQALKFIQHDCRCEKAGVATHGHLMRNLYYHLYGKDHIFANGEYFVLEL